MSLVAGMTRNPFASYGAIVYGDSFVGRRVEMQTLRHRILDARDPGCTALVGPPRIGKSSLAYQGLIYPREELLERRLLACWLNLPNFQDLPQLLRRLVARAAQQLTAAGGHDASLEQCAREVREGGLHWLDLQDAVQQFFAVVKRMGWRVVCVLDEFDSARVLFCDNPGAFQVLRELAYQPEWRICIVTVSRRPLSDIEVQSQAEISNFHGIFHDIYLRPFGDEDMRQQLRAFTAATAVDEPSLLATFRETTGGHPFLTAALGFHAAELPLRGEDLDLRRAAEEATPALIKYYDSLINILSENGSLDTLLQIVFGPVMTATRVDAEEFARYGLLKPGEEGYYTTFSPHFADYLRQVERSTDLWPLWRDTERRLRRVINAQLQTHYGTPDWPTMAERDDKRLKRIFDKARETQVSEQSTYGARASNSLLDYLYPWGLSAIILKHWEVFASVLRQDEEYWQGRFELLQKIRNPMAHSREESIEPHERQIAEGYCRELLHVLGGASVTEGAAGLTPPPE